MSVLVVEDSEEYRKLIARSLSHLRLIMAETVDEAFRCLETNDVSLILLDIQLPGRDGYSLLSELRAGRFGIEIPVLCLTGRSQVTDKVTAFSLGADDYILKPFDPLELRARVDSKLVRMKVRTEKDELLHIGDLRVDKARHRVWKEGEGKDQEIELTQTEFKILCCLGRRPGQVLTRDQMLVAAWGEDARVLERAVDVHVCSLRKKLGKSVTIQAVPSVGYKIVSSNPKKTQAA